MKLVAIIHCCLANLLKPRRSQQDRAPRMLGKNELERMVEPPEKCGNSSVLHLVITSVFRVIVVVCSPVRSPSIMSV